MVFDARNFGPLNFDFFDIIFLTPTGTDHRLRWNRSETLGKLRLLSWSLLGTDLPHSEQSDGVAEASTGTHAKLKENKCFLN